MRTAKRGLMFLIIALSMHLMNGVAFGQEFPSKPMFPNKPIRVIVPFSAGSASDIVARIVGQKLAEISGQPVIIDNRPGAIGTIGAAAAAKAAPDGYTISLGASGTHGSSVSLFKQLPYDPVKDFSPITLIGTVMTQ